MEVKIISGYGENTFQMDDADTMSLLNNAMRFHNKIKATGGVEDNTNTKAEKGRGNQGKYHSTRICEKNAGKASQPE